MSYSTLDVRERDGVLTITLNRPEVLNAVNQAMHDELQRAFDDFAEDDSQRLCVLRGAGDRAFCAGSDLKAIAAAGRPAVYPANGYAGLIERFDLGKPVIAAVDGVAVGGGFEIALACDLIIATTRSRFGLPEPLVGAMALGGGVHRLARQVGLKQAMGLILTGDLVDAHRADAMGLLTELVEPDALDASVDRWCERILRCAPLAISASLQSVMRGLDEPGLEAAMTAQAGYPAFTRWKESADRHEGALAFAERRAPRWSGR